MDWKVASAELQKMLDPSHVKPAKAYGPKGDYIEGWWAMMEANRIFGFGEWSYTIANCQCVFQHPREIGKDKKPGFGVTYTATVRVDVGGVIREDVGAGHGFDVDAGMAHESAIKEAVTDALKRALRGFGNPFGLALYDKTRANVGREKEPDPLDDMETFAKEVAAAVEAIERIASSSDLFAYWTKLNEDRRDIAADSKVIAAKDRRKTDLAGKVA